MPQREGTPPWPSAGAAWYAIGVLALVRLSAQLDLGILSLLVQPIKQDLHLTDGEVGLLLGFAFALFYILLGVPLALLVDRRSRRGILAVGITVWSVMTALTGTARSFGALFLFRVGVGAGESINGPATYSLIADYFPRHRLSRAIAVLNLGSVIGTGLSLVLGAVVIGALARYPEPVVPLLGRLRHWQLVFFIIGLPGLLVAALMMTVREPPRRGVTGLPAPSFGVVLAHLSRERRLYLPMFLGVAASGVASGGAQMWRPAFFQRTYGWSPHETGTVTGIAALVAAPLGLFLGTYLSERLVRRHDDANLRVVLIAWCLAVPLLVAEPLMPAPELAVLCGALALTCTMMAAPTQNAALQSVSPGAFRGRITALYLLIYTLAQQGAGPSWIAALTDYVLHDESRLRFALAISALITMPLGALAIIAGRKPYAAEQRRLRSAEQVTPAPPAGEAPIPAATT